MYTKTLYRAVNLGLAWDQFEPNPDPNNDGDTKYPYLLRSCGSDPGAVTVDDHVLHWSNHKHKSPYMSFSKHRKGAVWYYLKEEYKRVTCVVEPGRVSQYAPRQLYKLQVHVEDVTKVLSLNPAVRTLTLYTDEYLGTLRVRVHEYKVVDVPEKLKLASFAWFAANKRLFTNSCDKQLDHSVIAWWDDMVHLAIATHDYELLDFFDVAVMDTDVGPEEYPEEDEEIDSDMPEEDEEIDSDMPEEDEEIDSDMPEEDEEIDSDMPEEDEEIDSDMPEEDEEIDSDVDQEEYPEEDEEIDSNEDDSGHESDGSDKIDHSGSWGDVGSDAGSNHSYGCDRYRSYGRRNSDSSDASDRVMFDYLMKLQD